MKIIKFNKKNPIKPLFGLRLPDIVYDLYLISITKEAFEKTLKEFMHIDPKRLIKIVEAVEGDSKSVLILVIYDTFVEGKRMVKARIDTRVKNFNFPIFNMSVDETVFMEREIEIFKRREKI